MNVYRFQGGHQYFVKVKRNRRHEFTYHVTYETAYPDGICVFTLVEDPSVVVKIEQGVILEVNEAGSQPLRDPETVSVVPESRETV